MKRIKPLAIFAVLVILLAYNVQAQPKNIYPKEWQHIDSLVARALPKSALAEVKKIYVAAKKNSQDAQLIKCLVYMTSLQQETRENNEQLATKELENEIATSKEPAASILKSLLANVYLQYFERNRWMLYQRTNTTNFNKEDIATWTPNDFHNKISNLYLQSIHNKTLLKATNLNAYNAIIIRGNVRHLRPTLYDLLAQQALNYFKSDEGDIRKPAYSFEISQPEAFAPAADFAKTLFTTKDSLSLLHKALLIFQDLIAFHVSDAKPNALIDVDINRIQFVYEHSVSLNKEALYQQALKNIINTYNSPSLTSQASFLLASYYESLAARYQPLQDTAHRYDRIKAKEILEKTVRDSTVKNEGWVNSFNLLQDINRTNFSFEIEKVNIPGQPFRALVNYKNTPALFFRLIKINAALKASLPNHYDEKYWTTITAAAVLKSWSQPLPATNDLQQHAVEIKVDALPIGEYILLASNEQGFSVTDLLGSQWFSVSNISYVIKENQLFVLNRETGKPLPGATVQVYQQQYDYKTFQYTKTLQSIFNTNGNGYTKINTKFKSQNNSYFIDIKYSGDSLISDHASYAYYSNMDTDTSKADTAHKVFFFTDRSIYRPGQTVYFKGITVHKNNNRNSIVPGYHTTIFLEDANEEEVDSLQVTTNEYGSFAGKFTLPQDILNGEFKIYEDEDNAINFSVEEYKRPKFYVEFEKIKNAYKAGDSIHISGIAKAYAGNSIDGAKVAYRVVRQPRLLYTWMYRYMLPVAQPMEIEHGEIATGKDGGFNIIFNAIPDATIDTSFHPVFDYHIYADVTDIGGETRSSEQIVSAGYQSLLLTVSVDEKLPVNSMDTLSIHTENLNGAFQPAAVNVKIIQLLPEGRLVRKRYWSQPDQFVMNKEEYIHLFPHDEYQSESDFTTWQRGKEVYTHTDSTKQNGKWNLGKPNLPAGYYVMEFTTTDKDNHIIKDKRYIEVFDTRMNQPAAPAYMWTQASSKPIEPGEKASIQIATSASDIYLISQINNPSDNPLSNDHFSFNTISKQKNIFEFAATEADRGGYGVTFFFVKDNRVYQFTKAINIPWSNKVLKIEYATFRDKIMPGSEEKWKVKLTGYKADKVAAEMLVSMYDASLDQFKQYSWTVPDIWPVYDGTLLWNSNMNFSAISSEQKWINESNYRTFQKQYDAFIFNNRSGRMYKFSSPRIVKDEELISDAAIADSSVSTRLPGRVAGIRTDVRNASLNEVVVAGYSTPKKQNTTSNPQEVQVRKNFNETAFFFPQLTTDSSGAVEFSFSVPEAVTRWKLQALAHTKELSFGVSQKDIVTQKLLMVQTNAPRFLRQGDRIELSTKIVNLSGKEITGQAELQLLDATTNQSVDGWFQNLYANQYFTVGAGQSEVVKFPIEIPFLYSKPLLWRIVARSTDSAANIVQNSFSDGEEAIIPILTNKVLITETLPLVVKGNGTKNFTFEPLLKSGNNEQLQNHSLTFEYTANAAWYAVQALPYLTEPTNECAEQIWNRYDANSIAAMLTQTSPRLKQVFEKWKTADTASLLSNLQKNEELKSVLLQETPWVLQAKTEAQQKKNIALLFDIMHMNTALKSNLEKLQALQSENGGFVWFAGSPDDRYITQYILTGIGHLKKLNAIAKDQKSTLEVITQKALSYLDEKIKKDYDNLVAHKTDLKKVNGTAITIQYLYMRSFFPELPIPKNAQTAYNYFRRQAQQYWTKENKYLQGMIALALYRNGDAQTPKAILRSLKETSINTEMGMYWKENAFGRSWYWWQAPIETQALLIEAFNEISNDTKTVDALKTWLLKNKQTNNWRTTKATADACYALLLQGSNWIDSQPVVTIKAGSLAMSNSQEAEAGTGYFKQTLEGSFIKPDMGNISVTVQQNNSSAQGWGAAYWQYFEDMNSVKSAATPLQLTKKLFVEKNEDNGPVLHLVNEGDAVHIGDKIMVRIELRVDRDMEYIHMKDLRASVLEPVNVLSNYKWQGGLGYYESTKDASTDFFFNYLRKGTYVFEYPLFVTHAGSFSNGITTIQCLYAPEFSAHSDGVKLTVE